MDYDGIFLTNGNRWNKMDFDVFRSSKMIDRKPYVFNLEEPVCEKEAGFREAIDLVLEELAKAVRQNNDAIEKMGFNRSGRNDLMLDSLKKLAELYIYGRAMVDALNTVTLIWNNHAQGDCNGKMGKKDN